MISEYLTRLKTETEMSWAEIERVSGVPVQTLQRIFNGTTPNPGFDTVSSIVTAMGGSLDEITHTTKKGFDARRNSMTTLTEMYEEKIRNMTAAHKIHVESVQAAYEAHLISLRSAHTEHIKSQEHHIREIHRSRKTVFFCLLGLLAAVLFVLIFDILNGNIGYVRY